VSAEKLCVEWEEVGMEGLLDSDDVNLRVLRPRVVAVNQQRSKSEEQKN
jgi:hypothetical protein